MPNDAKCSRVSKIVTKFSLVEKRSTLEEPVKSPTPKRPDWFERRLQQFDNVTSLQSYGSDANRKKNGAGRESNAKEFPTKQSLPIERSDKKLETIADDGRVKQEQIVAVSWQEDSLRSQWFQSTTISHKTSEETSREIPLEPNDCLHRVDEEKQLKKAAEEQTFAVNLPKDSLRNQWFQSTTISHKTSEETGREIPLEPNDCLHRVDEEKHLKNVAEEQTIVVSLPKDSLRSQSITSIVSQEATAGPQVVTLSEPKSFLIECHRPENVGKASTKADDGEEAPTPRTDSESSEETQLELKGFTVDREADEEAILRNPPERRRAHEGNDRPETLLDLKEFLNEYQNGRTIKDAATRNATTESRSDSRMNEPPSATDEERARKTKKRPAKKKTNEATWKSVDFNLRGRRGDKLRPSNASSVDSIDRSSSRETPIVNATTDGSDSCAIVESETHAQTFYVDASDSSASDEGDRQRPNGRNAVLRASSYDEWEPLTPRRAFNRSDPAMISEATNWRVVDGLHDEAMWNDVERKMREISRSLTEDFRAADDDELALCSIPLHALNVTDYDERTKRFTSTVQIQLTGGGGGGVKRSQSSKVGADVRHSSTSNSSFEAYESRAPMKTEIYYDENRMPRIEMVRSIDKNLCEVDGASSEKKSKLEYTVMELLETEEKYVEHLRMIKEDYIDYLRKRRQSDSWSSALRYLFGNLEEIYAKSRDFLADLRACRGDLTEIARAFSTHEDLFKLYPIYSRNKPHSDRYVENCFKDILLERQRQLKQMLDLASYLLMPVQRLGKYKLLLDNVRKQLTMEDAAVVDVDAAIALVGSQLRRSNDYIAIDSIRDWPRGKRYRCDALGAFVMREQFVVKNSRNRKRELATVFLFEDMLVFTQQVDKDSFAYRDHIRMSDLGLVIIDHEQSVFHLRRFPKDPKKEIDTYVMEAKSAAVKKTWVQHLQANLFRQLMTERQKRKSSVIPVHDCVHKIVNIAAAHNDRQRRRIDNIDDDNRIKSSTVTKRNVSLRRRPAMYNKKHDSYRTRSWQPSDDDDDVVVEPEVEQKTGTYLNVAATIDGGAKTDQSKGLFVDDESDGGDVFGDEHRIDDTLPLEVHNYPRRDPFVLEFYNYHVCTEPTTDDDDRRNDDGCGKTFTGTKFKSKSIETVTARRKKTDGRRAFDRSKSTVLPPADNRQRSSIFYVDVFDFDASTTTSTWYTDYMDGKEAEDDGPTPSPNSVEEPDEDRVGDGFSIDASLHDLILNASVSVPKLRRSHSCGDVIDERPDRVNSRRFSASLTDLMAQIDSLYDLGDARSSCLRRKRSSCYSSNATASEYRSKEDVAKSGKMLKYNYIVAELVQTEKTYAKTLEDILNNYVYYLEDNFGVQLTEDVRKLFGYLCKIFHKTINFIEDLDQCNGRWESIAKMFMKNRELFELYPPYSLYKYKSDNFLRHQLADILKERQLALRQPFDLPSYLLSPVQRLAKYKLLLNEMAKLDGTSKPLNYAILSIDKQLRIGNTFIAMASIRGLPYIGECELGMFVMRDYFQVKLGKRYQSCVFLFEKMIVFTTTMENEEFLYQMALKFTDIAIGSDNSGTTSFDLLHYMDVNGSGKKKRETVVTLDAKSLAVKRNWMEWIFKKLFEQMEEEKRKSATGSRPSQTPGAAATDVKKRRKAKKAKRVYVKSKRNGLPFLHLL